MKRLTYIESTGTQYIDTGLSLEGGFKTEFQIEPKNIPTAYSTIIGSHESASPYKNNFVRYNRTSWNVGQINVAKTTSIDTTYIVEASTLSSGQYLIINGTTVKSSTSTTVIPSANNLYIFAVNNGSGVNHYAYIRLYYLKVYDSNNVLVGDYVPALDDNKVACLYDRVTRQLLYNSGTGYFSSDDSTLITDRTLADVRAVNPSVTQPQKGAYNYTDLNRVEAKVKELNDILTSVGYMTPLTTKLDWTYTDFFTRSDGTRYLNNVKAIRNALAVKPTTPAVPRKYDEAKLFKS